MKLLVKLAWRNVWRNRRRSIITVLAVFFATALSITMRGLQLGTYEVNIRFAVSMFSGFLQVQEEGYQDNPSLHLSFVPDQTLRALLDQQVTAYAPRVYADGLISFKNNSLGTAIFGISPASELTVTDILNKLDTGRFFGSDSTNEIVVGHKLLQNLKAGIGDRVVILAQGFDGSLGNMLFDIVGTVKTGSGEFDGMAVFMGLQTLQELVGMGDRINVIAVSLNDLDDIEPAAAAMNARLSETSLVALSWDELLPELKQAIEFDDVSGVLTLGILMLIVAFGVLNTVLMSVTERFREFGINLSIGMPQSRLAALVVIETLFMALIGICIGLAVGWCVNYYFVENPIMMTGDYAAMYEEYGFLPRLDSSLKTSIFTKSTLSVLVMALLAVVFPVYKVLKLEPLKGIRYT